MGMETLRKVSGRELEDLEERVARIEEKLGGAAHTRQHHGCGCLLDDKVSLEDPVSLLDLSRRCYSALGLLAAQPISVLVRKTPHELMHLRGFGRTCLREVVWALARSGLRLSRPQQQPKNDLDAFVRGWETIYFENPGCSFDGVPPLRS